MNRRCPDIFVSFDSRKLFSPSSWIGGLLEGRAGEETREMCTFTNSTRFLKVASKLFTREEKTSLSTGGSPAPLLIKRHVVTCIRYCFWTLLDTLGGVTTSSRM